MLRLINDSLIGNLVLQKLVKLGNISLGTNSHY